MRLLVISGLFLLQVNAAVFFTQGRGMSIFPAVSKDVQATSISSGAVVERFENTRPYPPCLVRRGRRSKGVAAKRAARSPSQKRKSYNSRPSSKHNKEKASFSHNKKSKQTAPSKSNYYKGDKEEALNFKSKPSRPREKSKLDRHCR
ncbi:hypothetical protein DSO57_1007789 [Entomophthora muscae]|uniref:Uncharacterized protein n=1 Tax=Entomophthora muscae TaxID=34485 RepID=A0ACC2RM38_9FUNG|nr:hypothetical protein DSO57_1007789 [Entomophthora muscae]